MPYSISLPYKPPGPMAGVAECASQRTFPAADLSAPFCTAASRSELPPRLIEDRGFSFHRSGACPPSARTGASARACSALAPAVSHRWCAHLPLAPPSPAGTRRHVWRRILAGLLVRIRAVARRASFHPAACVVSMLGGVRASTSLTCALRHSPLGRRLGTLSCSIPALLGRRLRGGLGGGGGLPLLGHLLLGHLRQNPLLRSIACACALPNRMCTAKKTGLRPSVPLPASPCTSARSRWGADRAHRSSCSTSACPGQPPRVQTCSVSRQAQLPLVVLHLSTATSEVETSDRHSPACRREGFLVEVHRRTRAR